MSDYVLVFLFILGVFVFLSGIDIVRSASDIQSLSFKAIVMGVFLVFLLISAYMMTGLVSAFLNVNDCPVDVGGK